MTLPLVKDMKDWLGAALDYIPQWLEYQMRESEQPGCVIAIAHHGTVVFERAFGQADILTGETLTPPVIASVSHRIPRPSAPPEF